MKTKTKQQYCVEVRTPRRKRKCFTRRRDAERWALRETRPGGSASIR